jgi:hypothetical protein
MAGEAPMAKEPRRVTTERLTRGRRGLTAFVGISGLTVGTVAVFESGNQGGTVALLSIGALASVFAVLGKIPLRWVVAGADVDMSYEESRETADTLSDYLNAEQLRLVTERLLDAAAQTPASTSPLRLAANLSRVSTVESEGHSRMRRFATLSDGWSYKPVSTELGADGVMTALDGTKIAVDFKAWGDDVSRARRQQRVHSLVNRLPHMLDSTGCRALLVLTDSTIPSSELGETRHLLGHPLRIATFADGYTFLLQKFNELREMAAAATDAPHDDAAPK